MRWRNEDNNSTNATIDGLFDDFREDNTVKTNIPIQHKVKEANIVIKKDTVFKDNGIKVSVWIKQKEPKQRWGKVHDKKLFELIKKFEEEEILYINELYKNNERQLLKHSGVLKLSQTIGWKIELKYFIRRLKKLINKGFSAREVKRLKTVMREVNYGSVNYENICLQFPGKTVYKMKLAWDVIREAREKRTMLQIDQKELNERIWKLL